MFGENCNPTLCHKIITYENLLWNTYFWKITIARIIPWKGLSFLEIFSTQDPPQNYEK